MKNANRLQNIKHQIYTLLTKNEGRYTLLKREHHVEDKTCVWIEAIGPDTRSYYYDEAGNVIGKNGRMVFRGEYSFRVWGRVVIKDDTRNEGLLHDKVTELVHDIEDALHYGTFADTYETADYIVTYHSCLPDASYQALDESGTVGMALVEGTIRYTQEDK